MDFQVKITTGKLAVKNKTNFEGLADLLKTPAKEKGSAALAAAAPSPKVSAAKSTPRRLSVSGNLL